MRKATIWHFKRCGDSPETTVTGPLISAIVVFVNLLTRLRINVVLPTPLGPMTAIITGGTSPSTSLPPCPAVPPKVRSTAGT
jgi:hypothetical protein